LEILTNLQIEILKIVSNLPDKEAFYLTGGTALSAFFLKHRKSHDLDFFTRHAPVKGLTDNNFYIPKLQLLQD